MHTQTSCVFSGNNNRTFTLRCTKIFLQIDLQQSSFVYISQLIFYTFDNVFRFIYNNWLMAPKKLLWFFRSLGCIATLKARSACFTTFPLWNLIVSELNLWQAQNKSKNICPCSSLKRSKGINKDANYLYMMKASQRLVRSNIIIYYDFIAPAFLYIKGQLFG